MAAGWWGATHEEDGADATAQRERREPEQRGRRASSGGAPRRRARCEQQAQLARSPLGLGLAVTASLYCGVKAGIQGYQHLRRRNLRHLVRRVAPVLDELGVLYWADFGTLLGAYREKDIILHDNDADLVVLNPDWPALLRSLRAALPGFRVFTVVPSEDRGVTWIRVVSGVGIMDLYGGYLEQQQQPAAAADAPQGDAGAAAGCSSSGGGAAPTTTGPAGPAGPFPPGTMVTIPQGHGDLCDVPASLVFPLAVMKFRGVPVSVPGDVPGVLRYRYGDTFMVPRYMDKGRDCVEQGKLYARLLGALGKAGLRV